MGRPGVFTPAGGDRTRGLTPRGWGRHVPQAFKADGYTIQKRYYIVGSSGCDVTPSGVRAWRGHCRWPPRLPQPQRTRCTQRVRARPSLHPRGSRCERDGGSWCTPRRRAWGRSRPGGGDITAASAVPGWGLNVRPRVRPTPPLPGLLFHSHGGPRFFCPGRRFCLLYCRN